MDNDPLQLEGEPLTLLLAVTPATRLFLLFLSIQPDPRSTEKNYPVGIY